MKGIIRKILKEMKEEKELSKFQKTILEYISTVGILESIKMVGDFENFNKILPDYFDRNSHKIDLINQIVQDNEPDGYIYFYELTGMDIKIWEEEIEDGHTQEDYITRVGDGTVGVSVWEYDENGEMYDEEAGGYYIKLTRLDEKWLNKIFEILVYYFL